MSAGIKVGDRVRARASLLEDVRVGVCVSIGDQTPHPSYGEPFTVGVRLDDGGALDGSTFGYRLSELEPLDPAEHENAPETVAAVTEGESKSRCSGSQNDIHTPLEETNVMTSMPEPDLGVAQLFYDFTKTQIEYGDEDDDPYVANCPSWCFYHQYGSHSVQPTEARRMHGSAGAPVPVRRLAGTWNKTTGETTLGHALVSLTAPATAANLPAITLDSVAERDGKQHRARLLTLTPAEALHLAAVLTAAANLAEVARTDKN